MPWVRVGKCSRCGRCCQLGDLLASAAGQGTQCNQDVSQVKCKHLVFDAGVAVCTIFGTDQRPEACSAHPGSTFSLTPGCTGYYFMFVERGIF